MGSSNAIDIAALAYLKPEIPVNSHHSFKFKIKGLGESKKMAIGICDSSYSNQGIFEFQPNIMRATCLIGADGKFYSSNKVEENENFSFSAGDVIEMEILNNET